MHRVVAVCAPGAIAFDLATAAHVFSISSGDDGVPHYEFTARSAGGEEIRSNGFSLRPDGDLEAVATADTIVVPAYVDILAPPAPELLDALRAGAARGARLLSICTGAFALAHAGLLDGRRATTHWAWAGELAARFPAIAVEPDSLYVDEGEILTSAGLSAGIDLCLHVVRSDQGAAVADRVARQMVAAPHREGGQAQFIERSDPGFAGSLEATRAWADARLDEPLDVAAMAAHARVSPRTFARRFRAETGTTPLQWLLGRRVDEARRLLEASDLPVEEVAHRTGFATAASLRQHFRRLTATTPSGYRRAFRLAAAR